jgi:quercetin dioxygenase-like cupin family protein
MRNVQRLPILFLCVSAPLVAPLAAQDAYTVTGQEQTIIYKSDWVRVRRVIHQPGETAPMHEHKQRVSVYLTDATVRLTAPDGKSQDVHYTPGLVKWSEPTRHVLLNIGKTPVEVVEVEFLAPRPATPQAFTDDPVQQDPKHFKLEFENDRVRVYRYTLGPHETSAMHDHLDRVAVRLKDYHARATRPDGATKETTAKAGEAAFSPSIRHSVENLSDSPYEAISIEFKTPAK